jgi:hypothetical protein
MRRNVLIFHAGALGDFILTWPLALALGRLHPQSRIVYVSAAGKGRLAEKALGVEWTDGEAGWHKLYEPDGVLPPAGAKLLADAHSIYTFVAGCEAGNPPSPSPCTQGEGIRAGEPAGALASAEGVWMNNIRRLAPGAKVVVLEPRPAEGYGQAWGEFLIEQLSAMPAVGESVRQMTMAVNQRGLRCGRGGLPVGAGGGDVVIHAGAGSPRKCWPVDRYVELACRIKDQLGRPVRMAIGEVEQETWSGDVMEKLATAGKIVRPASYVDLMAELSTAAGYVGNDSGPTHLAAMMGVAAVALFGPTDAAVWRPPGPRVGCISGWPMETIDVDAVYEKLVGVMNR